MFLELYNPRNKTTNNPLHSLPAELYNLSSDPALSGLELDKATPGGDPVWRVVITSSELDTTLTNTPNNLRVEIEQRPDTINFQPRLTNTDTTDPAAFNMLGAATNDENYDIERIIWFRNPGAATGDPRVFCYRGTSPLRLKPDEFCVIGPRQTTYIGSRPTSADPELNEPGSQSIVLSGQFDGQYAFTGMPTLSGSVPKTSLDFAVVADLPASYGTGVDPDGAPNGIGLSVTEPLPGGSYYPEPTVENVAPNLVIFDLYSDGATGTQPAPDTPFDSDPTREYPLSFTQDLYGTGTYPPKDDPTDPEFLQGYKTAILQRLANPLSDHDATSNPYISVDSMGIDVTVFNGEDNAARHAYTTPTAADWDRDEAGKNARSITDLQFASRERGQRESSTTMPPSHAALNTPEKIALELGNSRGNLLGFLSQIPTDPNDLVEFFQRTPPYYPTPVDPTLVAGDPLQDEHFGRKLLSTLGYANHSLGAPIRTTVTVPVAYRNSPLPNESRNNDPFDSASPQTMVHNNPYTWLHWANAPYVSKYDLMQVPSSSPQRLLFEYSMVRRDPGTGNVISPYLDETTPEGDEVDRIASPYGYLLNFFHSVKTPAGTPTGNNDLSAQFVRLFDFVHVPSRFNGTKKWFTVDSSTTGHFNPSSPGPNDPRLGYQFPFNYRSMFREPGKINLNTIPSEIVYRSIFDEAFWKNSNNPNITFAEWDQFLDSRRGYTSNADDYPSRFSNPFRTAATAELMPEIPTDPDGLKQPPVEATILRSKLGVSPKEPLFDLSLASGQNGLDNSAVRHYRTDENPMLRYQAYQRLGNIAGTQSNVFAVWVTIGYFEVEPAPVGPQHPDGWRLAEELGNDTGEINRHRAFYIIDRSVPVGYLPGEDLNAEQTIMLKRFIE